uniref:G-protein coupled receptors family 1 profile domain-containing protein n=1 Tax=Gopherus agassizii TaxID=38772 RepID=A0A452J1W7_9SAUR
MKVDEVVSVSDTTNFSLSTATTIPCPVNRIFTHRFLPAVYLIVSLLGLLRNGLGLWNLCAGSRRNSWNTLSVLMCNLGVADLLYVITLPFLVTYYLQGGVWLFGKGWCRLMRALFYLNLYASIGFLTCISIHRYLGIVYPLKMLGRCQTLGPPFFISAMVWAWVIIQVSPDFGFSKTDSTSTQCHDTTGHENLRTYRPYVLAATMTGFVIPFLIIIGCYCHVVVVLWRNENVDPNLKRSSIKLVVLTSKNIYVSYQVTRGLASFNSALNPLLYLMTSEECVSCMRTISQRAGQSLGSLWDRRTQWQSDQKKTSIILCEEFEEACDEP